MLKLSCLVYIKMYGYTTVKALYILNVNIKMSDGKEY